MRCVDRAAGKAWKTDLGEEDLKQFENEIAKLISVETEFDCTDKGDKNDQCCHDASM